MECNPYYLAYTDNVHLYGHMIHFSHRSYMFDYIYCHNNRLDTHQDICKYSPKHVIAYMSA